MRVDAQLLVVRQRLLAPHDRIARVVTQPVEELGEVQVEVTEEGDPVVWGEKALAHYEKLRIDPHTKRLVFSDGLDFDRSIALYDHFADRTQLGFGIGTNLTNDMGLRTLHIVMKLTHANRQPVAKLSDSPGKLLCDDETFLAYLRQVFKVDS